MNVSGWFTPRKESRKSVPEAGIEPALPYGKQILSLSCLPIPPLGHVARYILVCAFVFCSCTKRKNNPSGGVDYQQLRVAQQAWAQGNTAGFQNVIESQREGKEIFLALGARQFTQRGRLEWALDDLRQGELYALQCLGQDHHVKILLNNEHGLLNLKVIQALNIENDSLVECAKWYTISKSLQLHYLRLYSAQREVQLLQALSQWLHTVMPQEDFGLLYGLVVSETLAPTPDWVLVRQYFERLEGMSADTLISFERLILETVHVDSQRFCDTDWANFSTLPAQHQNRVEQHQYLCLD